MLLASMICQFYHCIQNRLESNQNESQSLIGTMLFVQSLIYSEVKKNKANENISLHVFVKGKKCS